MFNLWLLFFSTELKMLLHLNIHQRCTVKWESQWTSKRRKRRAIKLQPNNNIQISSSSKCYSIKTVKQSSYWVCLSDEKCSEHEVWPNTCTTWTDWPVSWRECEFDLLHCFTNLHIYIYFISLYIANNFELRTFTLRLAQYDWIRWKERESCVYMWLYEENL